MPLVRLLDGMLIATFVAFDLYNAAVAVDNDDDDDDDGKCVLFYLLLLSASHDLRF